MSWLIWMTKPDGSMVYAATSSIVPLSQPSSPGPQNSFACEDTRIIQYLRAISFNPAVRSSNCPPIIFSVLIPPDQGLDCLQLMLQDVQSRSLASLAFDLLPCELD